MVELCINKTDVDLFPVRWHQLDIYLCFSEIKIPRIFISSMEKAVEISPESPTHFNDDILIFNNIYLKIGYISSSQERIKLVTYNYLKKKMLNDMSSLMAKELRYNFPKASYSFQRIRLLDKEIESILKRHIEYLYSMKNVLGYLYTRYVCRYEEIFELNRLICK